MCWRGQQQPYFPNKDRSNIWQLLSDLQLILIILLERPLLLLKIIRQIYIYMKLVLSKLTSRFWVPSSRNISPLEDSVFAVFLEGHIYYWNLIKIDRMVLEKVAVLIFVRLIWGTHIFRAKIFLFTDHRHVINRLRFLTLNTNEIRQIVQVPVRCTHIHTYVYVGGVQNINSTKKLRNLICLCWIHWKNFSWRHSVVLMSVH
jgi:hypothetical protein